MNIDASRLKVAAICAGCIAFHCLDQRIVNRLVTDAVRQSIHATIYEVLGIWQIKDVRSYS